MKKAGKIVLWVVISGVILLVLPFVLISFGPVQNYAVRVLTKELSEKLNTKVSIGHVDLKLFSSLSIKDFYLEDLSGDTLINAKELDGRFSPLKLFKKQVVINSITLNKAGINLAIDTSGHSNIEFLNVLFKQEEKNDRDWMFVYQIDDIQLKSINFSFKDLRKPQQLSSKVFDAGNFFLSNINSRLSIDVIAKNHYEGKIRELSFSEKSGFSLKNFQTSFLMNDTVCRIYKTKLLLTKSEILIDSVVLQYDSIEALSSHFEKTQIRAGLLTAKVNPKDLSFLSYQLSGLNQILTANLYASGRVEDLSVSQLSVNYGKIGFSGSCRATGLPDLRSTYVLASIDDLHGTALSVQDLIASLKRKPFLLPDAIKNINKFSYKGKISGYLGNLALSGRLNTDIGSVETNLAVRSNNNFKDMVVEGHINTSDLNLALITAKESGLGNINLDADATVRFGKNVPLESQVDAKIKTLTYKNYTYNNLIINGNITKNTFEGRASIDDENGQVRFHGLVDMSEKNKTFHFFARVNNLNPNKLSLTDKYPNLEIAFAVSADFVGDRLETMNGTIGFDSIMLKNNGVFKLNNFEISSNTKNDSLTVYIESGLINGHASGEYSIVKLPSDILNMIQNTVPVLQKPTSSQNKNGIIQRNNFGFYFEIEPLRELCNVMEIAWTTTKRSTLSGFYNGDVQLFNVNMELPQITNGRMILNSTNFNCHNNEKDIKLSASTVMLMQNDSLTIALNSGLENDLMSLFIAWNNANKNNVIAGEILTNARIYKDDEALRLNVNILPTQVVLKNHIFDIEKSNILTDFKSFVFNKFAITGEEQQIKLDGHLSKSENDHLSIDLKQINLDLISTLFLANASVSFGGLVSGKVDISRGLAKPVLEAKLTSSNFIFNEANLGVLDVTSTFNHNTNSLNFDGIVRSEATNSYTMLNGGYYFNHDSLVLNGNAKRLNLKFIKKFTHDIFEDLEGYGTGHVKVYGNVKKKRIVVETVAKVDEGRLRVGFLSTDFLFNDTITVKRDSVLFKKIVVKDIYGNSGSIDGYLSYRYFDNLKYNINLTADKMLVFNTEKSNKYSFYGKAYATGSGVIYGNRQGVNISCNLTSEPNTKFYLVLDETSAATSNNFIQFINNDKVDIIQTIKNYENGSEQTTNLNANLVMTVNPNAELQLFLDSRSGDMIRATGDGNLRITYNNKTDEFRLFGNYSLVEGKYLFTFQQALRREFTISDGSSLIWNGAPGNPTINIKAFYQTKASLTDLLDNSVLNRSYSKNVPVNCILNLTENLMHPAIAFDLDLPSSDEDVKRALRNIVSTNEIMNREIIYLLAFGRFYNPSDQSSSTSNTPNDVLAVVTNTVGQQLNTMLSQISDKWNIGVNLKLSEDEAQQKNNEYGVTINYTPNDRIVINSNLGYRDDDNANAGTDNPATRNAIIDFDIEYKLNRSGRLSAKAYNRTNSNTYLSNGGEYTQGIGIVYRESFNSLKGLFAKWKQNRENRKNIRKQAKEKKKENKVKK
ncbi:MAG: translocation/assembly module TamB domain-containing protein [Prevotellaceae bacterium]|jgi:hypothetical protein|nr:translocation/assembly module TamB domain-containing protein [Prevotellaceae bacterium]